MVLYLYKEKRKEMFTINPNDLVLKNLQEYGQYFNEHRAIPSIYSGMKPSQIKILYGCYLLKLKSTGSFKKVTNLLGSVMPFYTHGDSSLESAITRMGQSFKMGYTLIQGSGHWGSQSTLEVPDAGAAAARYREARLTPYAEILLDSIKNGTSEMMPNFDGTMMEPKYLFAPFPMFMLFGQLGIGVGVATNYPSFILSQVADITNKLIDNPNIDDSIFANLSPYFVQQPTIINGDDLVNIYTKIDGPKSIKIRATFNKKGNTLSITNFPPTASPTKVIEEINKNLEKYPIFGNITFAQNTSRKEKDKHEVIGIDLTLAANTDINQLVESLCDATCLESTIPVNMVLLDKNHQPKKFTIKTALLEWIDIFKEKTVVTLQNEIDDLKARKHIIEGLVKALDEIDEIIELIKSSESKIEAVKKLMAKEYTEIQSKAILDMKLARLANLEYQDLLKENKDIIDKIETLESALNSPSTINTIMKSKINEFKKLDKATPSKVIQDIRVKIKQEEIHFVNFNKGKLTYTKNEKSTSFSYNKKEPLYAIKGHEIFVLKDENIPSQADLLLKDTSDYIFTYNKEGKVKLTTFKNIKVTKNSILTKMENVVGNILVDNNSLITLITKQGHKLQFSVRELTTTGRGALGRIGVKLAKDDYVVSCELENQNQKQSYFGSIASKAKKV